ncbi:hypothetical protein EDC04DRAFT_2618724 [Pisolithus marmoratus]|nr:hypothetical protein EDC04DRAFT_2618724 [Pisolithus marmoratus]
MATPIINARSRRFTRIRRAGLVLATPSNPLPISDEGYPVASLKRKISEDTLGVCPQRKVIRLALLLMAAKDDKPHGRRAVPSKPKRSEKFANVHLSKKVALLAPPVIIRLLMPARLLMTTKDGGQVVPLKRKRSEEFLGIHPPSKIARVGAQEIAIAAPACTRPIQCYTVESAPGDPVLQNQICSMWSLPNELLIAIAAHLPKDSLRTLTQVCRLFREVAAPLFFQLLHFEPSRAPASLYIDHGVLEALSVWRRTNAFVMPVSIWFPVAEATTDNDLNALSIFFESLQGCELVPRVHLQLFTAPRQPTNSFARLLNCIRASGCQGLHCHDVQRTYDVPRTSLRSSCFAGATLSCGSKLNALELTSSILFSPMMIPFTITTLCSSPITRLTLTNTSLRAVQWSVLLKHLSLRHLLFLEVDGNCPTHSLVSFLARHNVTSLTFSGGHPTIPRSSCIPVCLPSLKSLDGSPACIHSFASHAKLLTTVESLTVRFYRPSSSDDPLLETALACAAHFPNLDELCVRIPAGIALRLLDTPRDPVPCCAVKVLFLMCLDSPPQNIIPYCAPWLMAFRQIRRLYLSTDCSKSDQQLEDLFRSFSFAPELTVTVIR